MALRFCDKHGQDVITAYDPERFPGGCPECRPVVVLEVHPRALEVGGGWASTVTVNGVVVAGGAFPICDDCPDDGAAWSDAYEWAQEIAEGYGGKEMMA